MCVCMAVRACVCMCMCVCDVCMVVCVCPCSSFKRYHVDHHKYQGEDALDADIPSKFEVHVVGHNTFMKLLWVVLQPLAYSLRPVITLPKQPTKWELLNLTLALSFDALMFNLFGIKALLYMVCGTLLGT